MKVKENMSSMKLGNFPKIEAIYCGPFEFLERIGPIAYILASMRVHNVWI